MNSIDDRLTELESALDDQQARIEAHEETIAAQQETIDAQRERLAAVENGGGSTLPMSRRGALAAGGALGLLGLGAGTASAQGSGQIGTTERPVDIVYTEKLNGGITNQDDLRAFTGFGLEIYEGNLGVATDGITTPRLASNAVTGPKIANAAVTKDKIDNNAVGTGELGIEFDTVSLEFSDVNTGTIAFDDGGGELAFPSQSFTVTIGGTEYFVPLYEPM